MNCIVPYKLREEMKMKDLGSLAIALAVALLMVWFANRGLDYYNPPHNVKWVEYQIPKNVYLWNLVTELRLSDHMKKDHQLVVRMIKDKNHLKSFYLYRGDEILIPSPNSS